jgi:predicted Zn-dependent protease
MNPAVAVAAHFSSLVNLIDREQRPQERFSCYWLGERSDFLRLNHGQLRQVGDVCQAYLRLDLFANGATAKGEISLSGDLDTDATSLRELLASLRKHLSYIPADTLTLISKDVWRQNSRRCGKLPILQEIVSSLTGLAEDADLVAFYSAGQVTRGYANSAGASGWHELSSFSLTWCIFNSNRNSVKGSYSGFDWDQDRFIISFRGTLEQLELQKEPSRALKPGRYRSYLTPPAFAAIIQLLNQGGFAARELRTQRSPLTGLGNGTARLDARINLAEDPAVGPSPPFSEDGYRREVINLISQGQLAGCLVNVQSSREFNLAPNAANIDETGQSLVMSKGDLTHDHILSSIETGLYISNLWYLNYSDRSAARITGLTRFATFWVEKGEIQFPVQPSRFDDTIYRMLGDGLVSLSTEPELLLEPRTFGARSLAATLLPGVLIDDLVFTS